MPLLPKRFPSVHRRAYSSSSQLSLGGRPACVAICGAGPSGFYAATRLLSLPGSEKLRVDLFEQLPVPFGLSRYGVAPDHPEVKNCEHKFEEAAADPRFRFFGNARLGGNETPGSSKAADLTTSSPFSTKFGLERLRTSYDSVILTYGASLDRLLGIPGENTLQNILAARSFVSWYNGHPFSSPHSDTAPIFDLSKTDSVTVIGQGNVAMDVARILLSDVDSLAKTDIADFALAELSRSKVKHVEVVGRRGPLQVACTTKELREMMNLPSVEFEIDQDLLAGSATALDESGKLAAMSDGRMKKRLLQLMQKGSKTPVGTGQRSWALKFLQSPIAFHSDGSTSSPSSLDSIASETGPVRSVEWQLNSLVTDSSPSLSSLSAIPQGPEHTISTPTDLVLKSVGYRSVGVPGLPFDQRRGVVRNVDGRVTADDGGIIPGLYVSGWLSRGPTGVIANTMYDAFSTADLVANDLSSTSSGRESVDVNDVVENSEDLVDWEGWRRIEKEEFRRGLASGKRREKIKSVEEMLEIARRA